MREISKNQTETDRRWSLRRLKRAEAVWWIDDDVVFTTHRPEWVVGCRSVAASIIDWPRRTGRSVFCRKDDNPTDRRPAFLFVPPRWVERQEIAVAEGMLQLPVLVQGTVARVADQVFLKKCGFRW